MGETRSLGPQAFLVPCPLAASCIGLHAGEVSGREPSWGNAEQLPRWSGVRLGVVLDHQEALLLRELGLCGAQ